jgi:hypothetical protein
MMLVLSPDSGREGEGPAALLLEGRSEPLCMRLGESFGKKTRSL